MRIAHFCLGRCKPDSANGVDQAVYYLSKAQAALGFPVAVFELTAKEPIPIPGAQTKGYPPARLPFLLPGSLLGELQRWQPDLVHLHSIYSPANAALAAWLHRRGIPYVVTPHSSFSATSRRRRWFLKIPYKWFFELPTLNRAAFLHAVTDSNGLREYGARVPLVVAPNGIDLAAVPAQPREARLAARFPQVRGKRVFLYLGRLDIAFKGLDLLLKGFARAAPPESVLVLVGPDHRGQRRLLASLARRLGIEAQVIFAGAEYGPGRFDLVAGAQVFTLCSRVEGLPLALLEAAACARPCLVSTAVNPGGLVQRYGAGVVVQPSVSSVAEGLGRLARARVAELRRMGQNARRMVEAEFRWENTARILGAAYDRYARTTGSQDRDP
jgi:glycosyltransferase involved in cell wall biosynthesis